MADKGTGKTVVLGVSGGIAAYKSCALVRLLKKAGFGVQVVMTKNAAEFVTPLTFETLSKNYVAIDTFDKNRPYKTEHVAIADAADLVVIAPATANVLAKLANGIADDMLTTSVMACACPKIAFPAMNTAMYENSATKANIEKLKSYGWTVYEPEEGELACGAQGKGRMPEPEAIFDVIEAAFKAEDGGEAPEKETPDALPSDMTGLSVLVTAGPTREAIDPVRFITNHSTGKMGYAIAGKAKERGADVTLVSGPVSLTAPDGVRLVSVTSAEDMYKAVNEKASSKDIIIMAAAVADYRPKNVAKDKIKKTEGEAVLELERTTDILKWLGGHKQAGQTLCGFSMETRDLIENSRKKLESKNLDIIAANNLKIRGAGFGCDTNVLTLITKDGVKELPLMSKEDAADELLTEIMNIRGRQDTGTPSP